MSELVTPGTTRASVPPQSRRRPGPADPETAVTAAVAELHALLPGQVVASGEEGYDVARTPWIVNRPQQPVAVVSVRDVADVVAAVRCAARHGLSVAAQPVGHGATEAITGTVLLRTGALDEVTVDAQAGTVRVGAGAKWGAVCAAVEPTGLVVPAGSSPDPTVVGFTLGGGLSWFSRAIGLAARHVAAVELVDAAGYERRVTAASDPDLFWAMCGGGGDFGVVTAMELRLVDAGPLTGGRMLWPLEMARPVLHAFRDVTAGAPDGLTAWAHLFRFPPMPELPEEIRGKSFVSVDVTHLGDASELEDLLLPLRRVPAMIVDTVAPLPLGRLGDVAAEPVDPMPALETARLLHDLDAATVDAICDVAGHGCDVPIVTVQLRHLGGELARATAEEGPQGAIAEQFMMFAVAVPMVPELVAPIEASFAALVEAAGDQVSDRSFFNFLAGGTDASRCYTPDALARLRAVKAAVDPDGVVRSNRPTP